MFKLDNSPTVYVDVDGTLIIVYADYMEKDKPTGVEPIMVVDDSKFYPHKIHIDMLKEFKHRGFNIIVWSQGGSDWAESVVKKLGLEEFVDVIMPKPSWYFDDARVECFMPEINRIYKVPLGSNGSGHDSLPHSVLDAKTQSEAGIELAKAILDARETATIDLTKKDHENIPRDPDWLKVNASFHALLRDMEVDHHDSWVLGYLWKNFEIDSKTRLTAEKYHSLVKKFKKFQKLTEEQQEKAKEKYANVYTEELDRRKKVRQRKAADSPSGAELS